MQKRKEKIGGIPVNVDDWQAEGLAVPVTTTAPVTAAVLVPTLKDLDSVLTSFRVNCIFRPIPKDRKMQAFVFILYQTVRIQAVRYFIGQ